MGRRALLALLGAGVLAWGPQALGQTPKWVQLPPAPLANNASAFDAKRDRMLFVGYTTVWALELSGPAPVWSDLEVYPNPTVDRGTVVYDTHRDRLIAFQYRSGTISFPQAAQVWTLDLSAAPLHWTRMPDDGSLSSNTCCVAMVYDPVRDRVLAFGGGDRFGGHDGGPYVLSITGTATWTSLATSGVPPSGRRSPSLVYDPALDRVLVYGGFLFGFNTVYDETWSLSLSGTPTWSFLTPAQYVALGRAYHTAVIDSIGRRMVVSGGNGPGFVPYEDTWSLDLDALAGSAVWTELAPSPATHPGPRYNAAASVDPVHRRMVLFGGYQGSVWAADLWSLGLSGTPSWSPLDPNTEPPPWLAGHIGVVDPTTQTMLIGLGNGSESGTWTRPLDHDENWHHVATSTPEARSGSAAFADDVSGRAVVFGGEASGPTMLDSTWAFQFAPPGWSPITPGAKPSARADALGLFDPVRRKFILFGGRGKTPVGHDQALADTWSFNAATNQWAPLAAGAVGGRWYMAGAYDPTRDRLVAFGGRDTTLAVLSDTYVLPLGPGGTWTLLPTTGTPPAPLSANQGAMGGAVYDQSADRLLVVAYQDSLRVWSLPMTGPAVWSELTPSGRRPGLDDIALCLDAPRGRAVLYGRNYNRNLNAETWALYFDETTTAVEVSLVRSDANEHGVRLEWAVETGSVGAVTAYRREDPDEWRPIASLAPNGTGHLILEDRDVRPGARYDYRLGTMEEGGEHFFGEVSVVVPTGSTLRLDGARPNPAQGPVDLAFALAGTEPATLELVDLGGRRVLSKEVGSLGRGEHVMRVAAPGELPAGLYFVRLIQGRTQRSARVAIIR